MIKTPIVAEVAGVWRVWERALEVVGKETPQSRINRAGGKKRKCSAGEDSKKRPLGPGEEKREEKRWEQRVVAGQETVAWGPRQLGSAQSPPALPPVRARRASMHCLRCLGKAPLAR
jgi:hypothetical protein